LLSKPIEGFPVQEVRVGQAGDGLDDIGGIQKRAECERGMAFGLGAQADGRRHGDLSPACVQGVALALPGNGSFEGHFGQEAGEALAGLSIHNPGADLRPNGRGRPIAFGGEVKGAAQGDLSLGIAAQGAHTVPGALGFLERKVGADGVGLVVEGGLLER
jgi:hypothetical protein